MIGPRVGFVCHLQNFNKWWATLRAKSLPSFFNRNLTLNVQPESFAQFTDKQLTFIITCNGKTACLQLKSYLRSMCVFEQVQFLVYLDPALGYKIDSLVVTSGSCQGAPAAVIDRLEGTTRFWFLACAFLYSTMCVLFSPLVSMLQLKKRKSLGIFQDKPTK